MLNCKKEVMSAKADEDESAEGRNNVVVKIGMVGDAQACSYTL